MGVVGVLEFFYGFFCGFWGVGDEEEGSAAGVTAVAEVDGVFGEGAECLGGVGYSEGAGGEDFFGGVVWVDGDFDFVWVVFVSLEEEWGDVVWG